MPKLSELWWDTELMDDWSIYCNVIRRHADGDTDLAVEAIHGRSRGARVVDIRRRAFADLRRRGWSLPRIGKAAGYHHTTILHHLERYDG